MIARIWHGRTPAAKAIAYLRFLQERAIPDYRGTPGNLAALVLQQSDGDAVHFLTFTLWDSWQSIRAFAGNEPAVAVYYPEDSEYLLEFEPNVQHYEVGAIELGDLASLVAG